MITRDDSDEGEPPPARGSSLPFHPFEGTVYLTLSILFRVASLYLRIFSLTIKTFNIDHILSCLI